MTVKTQKKPHFLFRVKFLVLKDPFWGLVLIALGSLALFVNDYFYLTGQKNLTTYVGFVAAYLLFYFKFHADTKHKLFQTLKSFNERYSNLNQYLNDKSNASADQIADKVQDYINLCAEEYYFYSRGQIPGEVWDSWHCGMKSAWKSDAVREVALSEFPDPDQPPNPSYYGFNPYELGLLYAYKPKGRQDRDSSAQDKKLTKVL